MENLVKKFTKSSLALPLIALALLLLFNALFVDNFFKIEIMQNGNLYGRPIDILYRASSLIILALGMTFVIATGGIDISVGAVVAISSATCCVLLGGDISGIPHHPFQIPANTPTKTEIESLAVSLAKEKGMSVVFISGEMGEMVRTCSRIMIIRDHEKVTELNGDEISTAHIMQAIAGDYHGKSC
mgnify:CR=1 FL=1